MIQEGATLEVAAVIPDGAIQEVLVVSLCREAQVTAIAIVAGAGAYLQRENIHNDLHQYLIRDLDQDPDLQLLGLLAVKAVKVPAGALEAYHSPVHLLYDLNEAGLLTPRIAIELNFF